MQFCYFAVISGLAGNGYPANFQSVVFQRRFLRIYLDVLSFPLWYIILYLTKFIICVLSPRAEQETEKEE